MQTYTCLWCSGLEDVLGIKLPQDLSTDEARDTLAKLVRKFFTCMAKLHVTSWIWWAN